MKRIFALVYVLVLATQLPHVWFAYANLERQDMPLAHWTALGAAIAFELSTGVFTYRIVKGARNRWAFRGLAFFIGASIVANGYYYDWLPILFDRLMPVFATVALPLSLALFAEEFGTQVKRDEREAKRAERDAEQPAIAPVPIPSFICAECGRSFASQNGLAGHIKVHRNGREHERIDVVGRGTR
jgi:hypothetical protein